MPSYPDGCCQPPPRDLARPNFLPRNFVSGSDPPQRPPRAPLARIERLGPPSHAPQTALRPPVMPQVSAFEISLFDTPLVPSARDGCLTADSPVAVRRKRAPTRNHGMRSSLSAPTRAFLNEPCRARASRERAPKEEGCTFSRGRASTTSVQIDRATSREPRAVWRPTSTSVGAYACVCNGSGPRPF